MLWVCSLGEGLRLSGSNHGIFIPYFYRVSKEREKEGKNLNLEIFEGKEGHGVWGLMVFGSDDLPAS